MSQDWMLLKSDNKKEIINSLSLAAHNDRVVDLKLKNNTYARGKIGNMAGGNFQIGCNPHAIVSYDEVVKINMKIRG